MLDWDNPPSSTSSGPILHLCKVSSKSVHLFRRSFAYKKYGQTGNMDRQEIWTDRKYGQTGNMDRQEIWTDDFYKRPETLVYTYLNM